MGPVCAQGIIHMTIMRLTDLGRIEENEISQFLNSPTGIKVIVTNNYGNEGQTNSLTGPANVGEKLQIACNFLKHPNQFRVNVATGSMNGLGDTA